MIKAQELRIGNKVIYENTLHDIESLSKLYLLVGPSASFGKITYRTVYEELEPIPLTPEILQQCGCKYKKAGIGGADNWQGMDFWHIGDITFRGNVSTARNGALTLAGYFNSSISYLHQLQNLFYALTGTEITYNPK